MWSQKWSKNDILPNLFLSHLGSASNWFEANLTHIWPRLAYASSRKPLKWTILETTMGTGGAMRMCCVSMPQIALGTLVVIQIDEGDHLPHSSTRSTASTPYWHHQRALFNAPLEWCKTHNARAMGGLLGQRRVQKWPKMIFSKIVPDHLGSSNKWFKDSMSHLGPI